MSDLTYSDVDVPHAPGLLSWAGEIIATWKARSIERHNLTLLSGRDIHDLGLSPAQVEYEATKPFWIA